MLRQIKRVLNRYLSTLFSIFVLYNLRDEEYIESFAKMSVLTSFANYIPVVAFGLAFFILVCSVCMRPPSIASFVFSSSGFVHFTIFIAPGYTLPSFCVAYWQNIDECFGDNNHFFTVGIRFEIKRFFLA